MVIAVNELRGSPRGRAGRNPVSAQTTCSGAGASDGASASEAFSAREEWQRLIGRAFTAPKGQRRQREAELREHVRDMLEQGL